MSHRNEMTFTKSQRHTGFNENAVIPVPLARIGDSVVGFCFSVARCGCTRDVGRRLDVIALRGCRDRGSEGKIDMELLLSTI